MTTEQKIIRTKVGLLELAEQLGNVSLACRVMGYSRESFYHFKELHDRCGSHRPGDRGTRLGSGARRQRAGEARRDHFVRRRTLWCGFATI
jgi:hypothetical protein